MRKAEPKRGAIRTTKRFLWLPTVLPWNVGAGRQIWRWWERAEIVQEMAMFGEREWADIAWGDLSEQDVETMLWEVDFED